VAEQTARYRWPAEWERHAATWLTWPHNEETWPGRLERVESAFALMVRALLPREEVRINVADDAMESRVRGLLAGDADAVSFFEIPSDDAWARDHGPVFVVSQGRIETEGQDQGRNDGVGGGSEDDLSRLVLMDFDFNSWGRKYPPWDRDEAIARRCAEACGVAIQQPGFVLEGGSIDGDGRGTVLTSEACLLNENRRREGEGPRTHASMESRLSAALGARHVIWLADGIVGDDTDGHVDDFARFVAPGRVVCAVEKSPADPNYGLLRDARARLEQACDAAGRALEVVDLPMPPPVVEDGHRCPASYANFYLANGVALVPVFDAPTDQRAVSILDECLEGREVVPIAARDLVAGLGGVHCLTQQVPAIEPVGAI
jgi:agmatine deiminase